MNRVKRTTTTDALTVRALTAAHPLHTALNVEDEPQGQQLIRVEFHIFRNGEQVLENLSLHSLIKNSRSQRITQK